MRRPPKFAGMYKVAIIGDKSKSDLLSERFTGTHFSRSSIETLGLDFAVRQVLDANSVIKYSIQFWFLTSDPSPSDIKKMNTVFSKAIPINLSPPEYQKIMTERHKWLRFAQRLHGKKARLEWYSGTRGIILVFDIMSPQSFYQLPDWIDEFMEVNKNKITPMILIGNNADLRVTFNSEIHGDAPIPYESGLQYARELSEWALLEIPYIEVSTRTGQGQLQFNEYISNLEGYFGILQDNSLDERKQLVLANRLYDGVSQEQDDLPPLGDLIKYFHTHVEELGTDSMDM